MRRLLPMAALAAATFTGATFLGADRAEAVRILGRGADQCSVWLRVRTTPQAAEYREWFLGYLSASAYLKNRDILRDQTYDQVLTRITTQCQSQQNKRLDEILDGFFR